MTKTKKRSRPESLNPGTVEEEEDSHARDEASKKRTRKRKRRPKEAEATDAAEEPAVPETNPAEDDDELARTIYLEGIPFAATRAQVVSFLTQSVEGKALKEEDVRDLRLPQWQDTGRLRGYGHAVLASVEQCAWAMAHLHRRPFDASTGSSSRYITVAPAAAPKTPTTTMAPSMRSPPSATLVLRNLPYDATEETLQQAFAVEWANAAAPLPPPAEIRVVRHYQPPYRSKGLAYVEFATVAHATAWMEAAVTNSLWQGRTLLWDYDQGRRKASFRDAQHQHYKAPTTKT